MLIRPGGGEERYCRICRGKLLFDGHTQMENDAGDLKDLTEQDMLLDLKHENVLDSGRAGVSVVSQRMSVSALTLYFHSFTPSLLKGKIILHAKAEIIMWVHSIILSISSPFFSIPILFGVTCTSSCMSHTTYICHDRPHTLHQKAHVNPESDTYRSTSITRSLIPYDLH